MVKNYSPTGFSIRGQKTTEIKSAVAMKLHFLENAIKRDTTIDFQLFSRKDAILTVDQSER